MEGNLKDLHARVHSGVYRAKSSRRVYIEKADGPLRPFGIASLEDRIVQRAVVEFVKAIYELTFSGSPMGSGRDVACMMRWYIGGQDQSEEGELGARRGCA